MKLKCKEHNRRVMVLLHARKVIHRNDGTKCATQLCVIGGKFLTLIEIALRD